MTQARKRDRKPERRAPARAAAAVGGPASTRILVVEDNPHDAELLTRSLGGGAGRAIDCEVARTLAEALARLRAAKAHVVLLDLDLPDSKGLDTLARVRAEADGPIVVVSGHAEPRLVERALAAGAYEVLSKQELGAERLGRIVRLAALQASTEATLLQAAERLRATFDVAAVGIAHVAPDGRIQMANRKLCEILGYSRDELCALTVYDISHPDDRGATDALRSSMREGWSDSFTAQKRYLRKDGTPVWVEITAAAVRGPDGRPQYDVSVIEDITPRRLSEQRLEKLKVMYAALSAANEAILRARTPEELFERACEIAVASGGFLLATVLRLDATSKRLECVAAAGEAADAARRETLSADPAVPEGAGLVGRACREGRAVISNDYQADLRAGHAVRYARQRLVGSAAVFPLRVGEDLYGVLGLQHAEKDVFDAELTGLFTRLADNLAFALEALRRDRQRRRTRRALRDSEERFRQLTELSTDWYWEQDAELRLRFVSSGFEKLAGTATASVLGRRPWELGDTTPLGRTWDEYRALLERHQPFRDFEHVRIGEDGALHYLSISGEPMFDESGRFAGYRGTGRDISDRKRAEERLRNSIERFEIVARATNDVIWDWNIALGTVWWNENFQSVFGWQPAEVGGYLDSWTQRVHPEDLGRVEASLHGAIGRGDRTWSCEYRFRRKDGGYASVLDRGLMIHDDTGRAIRMIGAMMDVTHAKQAEHRIEQQARRNAAVARLGQFALGKSGFDEVLREAIAVLREAGCDVAGYIERVGEGTQAIFRIASGEGAEACVGQPGGVAPDTRWFESLRTRGVVVCDRAYFEARSPERPWSGWLRRMGSGAYATAYDAAGALGILAAFSLRDDAFGEEDLRFVESVANIVAATGRRHQAEAHLEYMAQFDVLTGLPNRNLLRDRLEQAIARARRQHWSGAVLFIDLDRFKLINDSLGHHAGDALIREVGERLRGCVRAGDTVGRVSGDEFAAILTDLGRADDAATVAHKMLEALARPFLIEGREVFVTASIGISVFVADSDDADTLLKNADMAMYRAKESGRNASSFFSTELNQRTLARMQLNTDLRHAVERQEFALHYQPKVDMRDGALVGLEALLRWHHPQRGMVAPVEFIPALEDSGLINPVGEWVIGEACRQIARWQAAGRVAVPIAVNLSAKQFRRRDLDAIVKRVLEASGIAAQLVELEITESGLMEDPEETVRVLASLRDAGLRISIDDFGTGYSSLSYLTRFPISTLKIDRSFVRDAGSSAQAASIVRAVIDMAHNLRCTVIAEGVETPEQVAFLRQHGCDLGQGYFFGRPVPAAEIEPRLRAA